MGLKLLNGTRFYLNCRPDGTQTTERRTFLSKLPSRWDSKTIYITITPAVYCWAGRKRLSVSRTLYNVYHLIADVLSNQENKLDTSL